MHKPFAIAAVILAGLVLSQSATCAATTAALRPLPALQPVVACAALAAMNVSEEVGVPVRIARATEDAGERGKAYCKVEGSVDPQIRFELRLPTSGWTQRYLQLGCGGLCGSLGIRVSQARGCVPVDRGEIALASTDMGHSGMGGEWAAKDPGAKIDFAYRGVHLTAVAAKALIARYYGQAPRFSYFSGCSDGGREALLEAQRFPGDFNGIAAGAPALNFTVQNSFYHAWNALANTARDGRVILVAERLPLLHAAVLKSCDAIDGLQDGLISDPRRCNFDPASIVCKPGEDRARCLSEQEVQTVRKIYAGAQDAQGRKLVVGGPMPGSELSWEGVYVTQRADEKIPSEGMAYDSTRYLHFDKPLADGWSIRDLKFDLATLQSFKLRGLYDATDPDLSAFRGRGGKLLLWHGWSDPHISPLNSITYLKAVQARFGVQETSAFTRLFMLPGMYHCFGGEGPFEFDVLTPLMSWVEGAQAPAELIATQIELPPRGPMGPPQGATPAVAPKIVRSRPVFPYPAVATYTGQGDVALAANFKPVLPGSEPADIHWLGEEFFKPGYALSCERKAQGMSCSPAASPKN